MRHFGHGIDQMSFRKIAAAMVTIITVGGAHAADLTISEPWVRGTVPAQKATGAFMSLSSKAGVRIVGASSPAAGVTEIHSMVMEGGVMKMRPMDVLEVPSGQTVELKPGGYHVMLMQLKAPISEGSTVPITFMVEGADKKVEAVSFEAPTRSLSAAAGEMKHDGMKMRH